MSVTGLFSLLHPNFGDDRHAWAQAVETRLSGLKSNSHREALHNLDVISRGILRRQEAGNGAGGPGHGFDITIEILAERVHGNSHRLLGMHFPQLAFLEICRHPEITKIGNGDEPLPLADMLSDVHGALADDSGDRRNNFAIAEVQL